MRAYAFNTVELSVRTPEDDCTVRELLHHGESISDTLRRALGVLTRDVRYGSDPTLG